MDQIGGVGEVENQIFDEFDIGNVDDNFEKPELGMQLLGSEDTAYDFYNRYALRIGFSIRKGAKRRDCNGGLRQCEFVCSKEGHREFEETNNAKKFNQLDTRTGCKARIRFTIENNVWIVSHHNSKHNHRFAVGEEKCNLRSGKNISEACAVTIKSMVNAGIKPVKSFAFLANEVGGQNNLGFDKRYLHNHLRTEKEKMIDGGDGQSIINHFRQKQTADPLFFHSVQVDQHNRMANFFWRDGKSKLDYDAFGDVVVFDTTYRTNQYNLICAPFVGINHHWKNILFGCAFLKNETTESFTWLFETFKEAMGGQQPKTIFTDQDQAMANSIEKVFPLSCHRLCLWHISKNARQHLAGYYANSDFKRKFNKCLSGCINVHEFQSTWEDMLKSHNLENNSWLKRLYSIRMKWCTAFSMDIFSARMKSTQRSESTNNVFHQIMKTSMSLIQVMKFYDKKAEEMRQEEINEDFRCKNGLPAKAANYGGLLGHAAIVYTLALYKMFEVEFFEAMGMNCVQVSVDGNFTVYKTVKFGQKREYVVQFDKVALILSCSCKLFEILGLLCSHTLRVLIVNNVNEIPTRYILERWTKGVRDKVAYTFIPSTSENEKASTRTLRLSELNFLGQRFFDKASKNKEWTNILREKMN